MTLFVTFSGYNLTVTSTTSHQTDQSWDYLIYWRTWYHRYMKKICYCRGLFMKSKMDRLFWKLDISHLLMQSTMTPMHTSEDNQVKRDMERSRAWRAGQNTHVNNKQKYADPVPVETTPLGNNPSVVYRFQTRSMKSSTCHDTPEITRSSSDQTRTYSSPYSHWT